MKNNLFLVCRKSVMNYSLIQAFLHVFGTNKQTCHECGRLLWKMYLSGISLRVMVPDSDCIECKNSAFSVCQSQCESPGELQGCRPILPTTFAFNLPVYLCMDVCKEININFLISNPSIVSYHLQLPLSKTLKWTAPQLCAVSETVSLWGVNPTLLFIGKKKKTAECILSLPLCFLVELLTVIPFVV